MIQWVKDHNAQFENSSMQLWCDYMMWHGHKLIFLIELKLRTGGDQVRKHTAILNKLKALDKIYLKVLKPVAWSQIFFIALGKLMSKRAKESRILKTPVLSCCHLPLSTLEPITKKLICNSKDTIQVDWAQTQNKIICFLFWKGS